MTPNPLEKAHSRVAMWALALALIAAATILGFAVSGSNALAWDISVARWVQRWEGSFSHSLYQIGDLLGSTILAIGVALIGLILAIRNHHRRIALFLVLVMLLRLLATQLKPIFDSPRPTSDHVRLLEHFDGTGYPSGHSTTIAMLAGVGVLLVWRYVRTSRHRLIAVTIAALAMLLVGWSRVWAGAHWPTDVLGGWSYGIALCLIAWCLTDLWIDHRFRPDTVGESATG